MERRRVVAFKDEAVLYTTVLNADGTTTIQLGHTRVETPEQRQRRERREARNRERRLRGAEREERKNNDQ
jgi:hypothetical protein